MRVREAIGVLGQGLWEYDCDGTKCVEEIEEENAIAGAGEMGRGVFEEAIDVVTAFNARTGVGVPAAGPGSSVSSTPILTSTSELRLGAMKPQSRFLHHALLALSSTPIIPLLTITGDTWLFQRKITERSVYIDAKVMLRAWIEGRDSVAFREGGMGKKRRRAGSVLGAGAGSREESGNGEKKVGIAMWNAIRCLGVAMELELEIETEGAGAGGMFYLPWCVYVCCLICWAYGFDAANAVVVGGDPAETEKDSHGHSHIHAPQPPKRNTHASRLSTPALRIRATDYLSALLSYSAVEFSPLSQSQSHPDKQSGAQPATDLPSQGVPPPPGVINNPTPLIEYVRRRWLSEVRCGLLIEAEGVLDRLVRVSGDGDGHGAQKGRGRRGGCFF